MASLHFFFVNRGELLRGAPALLVLAMDGVGMMKFGRIYIDGVPVGYCSGEVSIERREPVDYTTDKVPLTFTQSLTFKLSAGVAKLLFEHLFLTQARAHCVAVAQQIAFGTWAVRCAEGIIAAKCAEEIVRGDL